MSRLKSVPRNGAHHPHAAAASGRQTQMFGELQSNPIALDHKSAAAGVTDLNRLLADTLTLRDLYKKHHWQAAGPVFYMIHLLYDKHYEEQANLADLVAERVQNLGGVAIAMAPDVAEATGIARPPKGREAVPAQIARLVEAHRVIIKECRSMAKRADERGDDGTNDLLVSQVIRTNELQAWFVDQHLR